MAELRVVGDYRGPGEQLTAETLARHLPDGWVVIANRSLPTQEHDDLDLTIVGRNLIFVVENKHWGPSIRVTPGPWIVKQQSRQNPTDRVSFLARKLAGLLRTRVAGYPKKGRLVESYVVLSYPDVQVDWSEAGPEADMVVLLAQAAQVLADDDRAAAPALAGAREATIDFLDGWPQRNDVPTRIGAYRVLQEVTPLGRARVFAARDDVANLVFLRCYPMDGWGPHIDPDDLVRRERKAIEKLAHSGRTLRTQPVFDDDLHRWIVVPVVLQPMKTLPQLLAMPTPPLDPATSDIADIVKFLIDAFGGLKDIHAAGVVHRGIAPSRVALDGEATVKFTDFYLAHLSGEATVADFLNELADVGKPFRAPECRELVGSATAASDVYSLALALLWWLHASANAVPDVDLAPKRSELAEVAAVLRRCLVSTAAERPDIEETLVALRKMLPVTVSDNFAPGELVAGRYLIERALGEGGFAKSWLASDQKTGQKRVLKQYSDSVPRDSAAKEFKAASSIVHDRCARVWDINDTPAFLVVDYVDGESLANACKSMISAEDYRRHALDILKALAYMHDHDYLHNDITPSNIIIEPDGRARLIDFGLTRGQGSQTRLGLTPLYAAPELAGHAKRSTCSDLYGLGVTFLRCMVGRLPFQEVDGDYDKSTLKPLSEQEKTALGPLGVAIAEQFFRLVVADPSERPDSARHFADDLRRVAPMAAESGTPKINPTVDLLRQLYRGSKLGNAGNRGLDTEFAENTYVDTLLDTELTPKILQGRIDLVILTGNPGDGKTSYLKKLRGYLLECGASPLSDGLGGWVCQTPSRTFSALYDASEARDQKSSDDLVIEALNPPDPHTPHTALLAINDGRLRQFFLHDYSDLYTDYHKAIRKGLSGENPDEATRVAYVDLKRRTLAPTSADADGIAGRTLDLFTHDARWTECEGCNARDVCPILRNRTQLRGPGRARLLELVTISHLRRQRRATFRDFRSAAGWVLTGDRGCTDVHATIDKQIDLRLGDDALHFDLAFDPRSTDYLIREWADLDPTRLPVAALERDDRASNGHEPWHRRESLNRRAFFGDLDGNSVHQREATPYRFLQDFQTALGSDDAAAQLLDRILLGLSRLLGAFGYDGPNLALQDGENNGWAVLREIPAADFHLKRPPASSPYVEQHADELVLIHPRAQLALTLDSVEMILRAADGALINDAAANAIKLELSLLAGKLMLHPTSTAIVVTPSGAPNAVAVRNGAIAMESH
ncbi:protein kinase domain-containing protein [Nocardia violaceofusca]|uniref:protein kinase domain-containing protein n=1 Tax=Nocardia violaceofusca TaxID=941182 RepID=UPI0007A44532|nr:protein kinase [Nocardia violaceofusca]